MKLEGKWRDVWFGTGSSGDPCRVSVWRQSVERAIHPPVHPAIYPSACLSLWFTCFALKVSAATVHWFELIRAETKVCRKCFTEGINHGDRTALWADWIDFSFIPGPWSNCVCIYVRAFTRQTDRQRGRERERLIYEDGTRWTDCFPRLSSISLSIYLLFSFKKKRWAL